MTEQEELVVRLVLALSHEDGKCHIYVDDGEIQCNNITRHGHPIDFKRDSITTILNVIQETRLRELKIGGGDE